MDGPGLVCTYMHPYKLKAMYYTQIDRFPDWPDVHLFHQNEVLDLDQVLCAL